MQNGELRLITYKYRWVVLLVFSLTMAIQQLLWITFAAITKDAAAYYGVSDMSIGMLSMVFMLVYILISIPASWVIDTYGYRFAVGLGAILTGVFGMLRGVFSTNFTWVMICQIGIAIGQPFILNSVTKICARWFPIKERATASGYAWLAGYLGLIIGLVLTPYLLSSFNMQKMLIYYGILSVAIACAFIVFSREYPPSPQCAPKDEERSLVFDGLKHILANREFIFLMIIFFIGLGIFNGLSTWIENILRPRGFSSMQAGIIGGVMVGAGVVGSAIVPVLSDKFHNRVGFILLSIGGAVPGLIGFTVFSNFWLVIASAIVLGFFMMSSAPLGLQYGSEIAYPAPEGTSNGILMMMGQISGVIFIFGMDAMKSPSTGSMSISMIILIILMVLTTFLCTALKESNIFSLLQYKKI